MTSDPTRCPHRDVAASDEMSGWHCVRCGTAFVSIDVARSMVEDYASRPALSTTPAPLDVAPARHPIWEEVADELHRAQSQHGPMASGHEAQSVIGEEFHEFTLAVWFGVDQKGRPADPRAEAVQIAAMAIRYILDVADRSTQ